MRAYHFTGNTLRDGSPIPSIGHKLAMPGKIIPCKRGYHASEHPFDALTYAPGPILHLVELSGEIIPHNNDKVVASERTILKSFDATGLLHEFACNSALSVIHLWKAPEVVKEYLTTRNPKLKEAASAAWAEAAPAIECVMEAASAAWAAASAAWAEAARAAEAAAEAASAAWAAAWAAEAEAEAAEAEAWPAAVVARKTQRDNFKCMVDAKFDSI